MPLFYDHGVKQLRSEASPVLEVTLGAWLAITAVLLLLTLWTQLQAPYDYSTIIVMLIPVNTRCKDGFTRCRYFMLQICSNSRTEWASCRFEPLQLALNSTQIFLLCVNEVLKTHPHVLYCIYLH